MTSASFREHKSLKLFFREFHSVEYLWTGYSTCVSYSPSGIFDDEALLCCHSVRLYKGGNGFLLGVNGLECFVLSAIGSFGMGI